MSDQKLALNGGTPVKTGRYGTGVRYTEPERQEVLESLDSGRISYWSKNKVNKFCSTVTEYFDIPYCAGCSSGSAALHAAVGALEIEPGYEVITSPITDMGTLIGILYQNLIPVFADVDPHTYNITAESIAKVITPRTRGIIVVHLAGNPCDMEPIMELSRARGIPVIEDCAQCYGALYKGRKAGTIGDIGAFSLNESKHLSSGEGGFCITANEKYYVLCHNYMDKYYDRLNRGGRLSRLAPCYRLSELQYAVATAQFGKLDSIIAARRAYAAKINDGLKDISGIVLPEIVPGAESAWWFYMFRLEPGKFKGEAKAFAEAMCAEGAAASAGYIPRPIYQEELFAKKSFFPGNVWPAEIISGQKYSYTPGLCPVAEEVLQTAIRMPVSEFYSNTDAEDTIKAVRKVAAALAN